MLTDTMFGVYTAFVMHTHNMCFFLQSAIWQQQIDKTVDRLQIISSDVAGNLEVQSEKQEQLILGLDAVSDASLDILSRTTELQTFISHLSFLVEKIAFIQEAVYTHFTTFENIFFYCGAFIAVLIVTCVPGLNASRMSMIGSTGICFTLEYCLAYYNFSTDQLNKRFYQIDELQKYRSQNIVRRFWLILCSLSWIRSFIKERQRKRNTQEAVDISRRNNEILSNLEAVLSPVLQGLSYFSDDDTDSIDHDLASPTVVRRSFSRRSKSRNTPSKRWKSPSRCGYGRYNLRQITPPPMTTSNEITWPGFTSDESDGDYDPWND